jgi:hypothetical protein
MTMAKPKIKLPGTVVPPLTPFTEDLRVDYDKLAGIVDYVVADCGASMVVAAGVEAQEYQYLDFEARKELMAKTIEMVAGRAPVVAGDLASLLPRAWSLRISPRPKGRRSCSFWHQTGPQAAQPSCRNTSPTTRPCCARRDCR